MKAALPNFNIRHSPKAKTLRLKVTRMDGLLVVIPRGYDERKVPALLRRKRVWIADALSRVGETKRFLEPTPAAHLPETVRLAALGETWALMYRMDRSHSGLRLRADKARVEISGAEINRDAVIRKLKDWLRFKVREGLFPLTERLAAKHHLKLGGLLVKSQRTRWASCSNLRNLSLNTKLLFLSPDLVRYAILHELCHTVYMNHGREFWRLVQAHEPTYKVLDLEIREAWKRVPQWAF